MESIKSTLQNELSKNKESKNKEKLKTLSMLVISNIFVSLLTYSFMEPKETKEIIPLRHEARADHSQIVVPLKLLVDHNHSNLDNQTITLLNHKTQILVTKAYLLEKVREDEGQSFFKIEISNKDLIKIRSELNQEMIALPYVQNAVIKTVLTGGNKYEVDF